MKRTVCTVLSLLLILSSLFALNLITHAASGAWAIQTTRDKVGTFDYSDYDWDGFGENLFPDPTVDHFDVGGEYGRYAKLDSDHNPVAINPYYWWDKYNDAEYGFKRYIDDLINGGNIDLSTLTQDVDGYYELAPGYNYGKPSGTLTFHVAMRSPLNWNAVKKSGEYASLTDDGTGVLRFSSSGAWRAVPLPKMEANKYYIVKFNMKSADKKNGSLELCLQFENGNSDLGENAAAVELGSGPACGKVDTFCFVVYSGESAKTDPFIKFYCQTETFFDDFGMYEVSESYVRKQAEGVKLTDPPVYVEPLAFQTTIEGKNADGPVIDYSDFDWDALGENLVPDPTVSHFDAGETGDQYGRYAKIDADYNPVDVNPYYWWDKASDPANGFTGYYKDLAEHDKFDLSVLPQDANGYYELEAGKCYGAAVRHADQGNKYLVDGVEYDPMFRSPMNWNNGLTIGTYESLTDDGTGVLHYTGAANGSRRYFPLPEMEEDSYYVIKFDIKSNAVNNWTIDFFFWNKPVDEPDSEFNMGVFEADKVYTVSFLAYTGSESFTDPFIRIYLMGCESLFDNFGVYKVTKEYAYLCSDGAKLYKNSAAGDINGDDEVDNKDLTRLFQHLSNWEVEVNEDALDLNGDGSVDNKDLTRLFQYLSNWDVAIF